MKLNYFLSFFICKGKKSRFEPIFFMKSSHYFSILLIGMDKYINWSIRINIDAIILEITIQYILVIFV